MIIINTEKAKEIDRQRLVPLSKRQFSLLMFDKGLTEQITTLFANNPREKIEFDNTDKIERTSPTVQTMIQALGWTNEQVDSLWLEALAI